MNACLLNCTPSLFCRVLLPGWKGAGWVGAEEGQNALLLEWTPLQRRWKTILTYIRTAPEIVSITPKALIILYYYIYFLTLAYYPPK